MNSDRCCELFSFQGRLTCRANHLHKANPVHSHEIQFQVVTASHWSLYSLPREKNSLRGYWTEFVWPLEAQGPCLFDLGWKN